MLRTANLVRTDGSGWEDAIGPYHDRVREAVFTRLPPARRTALHRQLARTLEACAQPDAERLSFHWLQAGDPARARGYAVCAGEQAARALAFERAAACFEQALALFPEADPDRRALHIQLADALAFAGRGSLAASHFEAAARASSGTQALELRRRAAEQLLISGHFDRGIEASRGVLRAIGMRLPATRISTLIQLVYYGLRVRLRGLWFRERSSTSLSADVLTRIDTCFSMAAALGFVDTLVGLVFQSRALLLALAAGDRDRVARSAAMHAAYTAMGGGRTWRRTAQLLECARTLSARSGAPKVQVFASGMTGIALFCNGRFREASAEISRTLALLEDGSMGLAYERFTARMFMVQLLGFLGRYREMCGLQREGLQQALSQQNVYATVNLQTGFGSLPWLIADRPAHAESQVDEAMRSWSQRGFHLEHFYALVARISITLYADERKRAHVYAEELLRACRRSLLWRMQMVRFRVRYHHGLAALGLVGPGCHDRASLLDQARNDARAIERERAAWMRPFVLALRAGIAYHEGRIDESCRTFAAASQEYTLHDMTGYAAAARAHAARLRDDATGDAELAQVAAYFASEHVVCPERLCRTLLPVLPSRQANCAGT